MATQRFDGDVVITGGLTVAGTIAGSVNRSTLVEDPLAAFALPLTDMRIWDAFQTNITTAAADDLGLTAGVFGTGCPYIVSRDLNALGASTGYCRTTFQLPPSYVSGQTITVRVVAGMISAVASVSATVDVECYLNGRDVLVDSTDLCTTATQSCNSTTFANYDFTLTPTNRAAGDWLDFRFALILNSATASSHFGAIALVEVLLDIKG